MPNHNGRTPHDEPDDRYMDRGGQPGGQHYFADRDPRGGDAVDRDRFGRGYGYDDNNLGTERSGSARRGGGLQRGPHYGKGPQGFQRTDERIKELVSEALYEDDHVDASEIRIEVAGGEVTMTGTVDDRRTKRMAEACVEGVRGVNDVHNELQVRPHS